MAILVVLAGYSLSFPFFSYSTAPDFPSIKTAASQISCAFRASSGEAGSLGWASVPADDEGAGVLEADAPDAVGAAEGDALLTGVAVGSGVDTTTDGAAAALIVPNKNIIDNSINTKRLALNFSFIFFLFPIPFSLR